MIGNDIVDLKYNTFNWERPGFLDKIFTLKEQMLIFSSENKHQMVWLLWSMKEAAYKVHVQEFGKRFFNPKRLVCEPISVDKGSVIIDGTAYHTTSISTEEYIYTIAKKDQIEQLQTAIFKTESIQYNTYSNELKQHILRSISDRKALKFGSLKIKKSSQGIPKVFNGAKQLPITLSLTHCGRFCGYVYF